MWFLKFADGYYKNPSWKYVRLDNMFVKDGKLRFEDFGYDSENDFVIYELLELTCYNLAYPKTVTYVWELIDAQYAEKEDKDNITEILERQVLQCEEKLNVAKQDLETIRNGNVAETD